MFLTISPVSVVEARDDGVGQVGHNSGPASADQHNHTVNSYYSLDEV